MFKNTYRLVIVAILMCFSLTVSLSYGGEVVVRKKLCGDTVVEIIGVKSEEYSGFEKITINMTASNKQQKTIEFNSENMRGEYFHAACITGKNGVPYLVFQNYCGGSGCKDLSNHGLINGNSLEIVLMPSDDSREKASTILGFDAPYLAKDDRCFFPSQSQENINEGFRSQSQENLNEGFRGIKWGTSADELRSKGLKSAPGTTEDSCMLINPKENLSLGNVPIKQIVYWTCGEDKLSLVIISANDIYADNLKNFLLERFGKPFASDWESAEWNLEKVSIKASIKEEFVLTFIYRESEKETGGGL